MLTVHEVSQRTGVSIRALHHYDEIGLLRPTRVTEAGYRLYDDTALERLQQILFFRELQFPLKEIAAILDSPDFDRAAALDQQIRLLELRKEHLENLIAFAEKCRNSEVKELSFEAFDTEKINAYAEEAKKKWGHTDAYAEYRRKAGGRGTEQEKEIADGLMKVICRISGPEAGAGRCAGGAGAGGPAAGIYYGALLPMHRGDSPGAGAGLYRRQPDEGEY